MRRASRPLPAESWKILYFCLGVKGQYKFKNQIFISFFQDSIIYLDFTLTFTKATTWAVTFRSFRPKQNFNIQLEGAYNPTFSSK